MASFRFPFLKLADRNATRIAVSAAAIVAAFLVLLLFVSWRSSRDLVELRKAETIRFAEVGYRALRPIVAGFRQGALDREEALTKAADLVTELSGLDSSPESYYFFGLLDGPLLVEPAWPPKGMEPGRGPLPEEDAAAVRVLRETARRGGGFATYRFPAPGRTEFTEKISFVITIPELDAYIGTGLYVEDAASILRRYFGGSLLLLAAVVAGMGLILLVSIQPVLSGYRILVRLFSEVERDPETRPAVPRPVPREGEAGHLLARFDAMLDSIARNREELRRTVTDLGISERRYRGLVENMTDAVFLVAPDGRPLFLSPQVEGITGRTPAELMGMSLPDILEPESKARALTLLAARNALSLGVNRYALQLRHSSGGIREVEITTVGVADEEGKLSCFQGIARDVTDARRMERELERTQRLEAVGMLAGGIAHDFNNLLAIIEGNVSLCREAHGIPADSAKGLKDVMEATERGRRLTQQLLTFSRGGEPVKREMDLVRVVTENAEFALRGSRLRLRFEFSEDLCLVDADEDQVAQVAVNLVSHARRHAPEGDTIVIAARNVEVPAGDPALKAGWYALLEVHDGGAPLPPEEAARAFDAFFESRRDAHDLDLPVVLSIARRHGGHAAIESSPEDGNVVKVWLPAAPSCHAAPEAPAAVGRGARVLVMDDEEMIRRMLCRMLQRLGHEAQAEADGEAALGRYRAAMAEGRPFDLVILDLTVPGGLGGRETLEGLRAADPKVRAVFSSGYSADPVMAQYRESGAAGVLSKPFRIEDLERMLRSVLGG